MATSEDGKLPSRPTTPHRRSNSAASNHSAHYALDPQTLPLEQLMTGERGALEEMSDGMATLDANLQHLQVVHESLANFTESFASFLHGVKMNAWCVEFSEAPAGFHFKRDRTVDAQAENDENEENVEPDQNPDETYMTDNHSFITQPTGPTGIPKPRPRAMPRGGAATAATRGTSSRAGSSATRGTRGARGRGARGGPRGGRML